MQLFCFSFYNGHLVTYSNRMAKVTVDPMLAFQRVLHPLAPPNPNINAEGYYGGKLSPMNKKLFEHAFWALPSDSGLFSHSQVPAILDDLRHQSKHLTACAVEVTANDFRLTPSTQKTTAYIISRTEGLDDAIDFIRSHYAGTMHDYNRPPNVAWHSLRDSKDNGTPRGWLDPATQNLYFHDRHMFEQTCRCLKIERFEDRSGPTTKIQEIATAPRTTRSVGL